MAWIKRHKIILLSVFGYLTAGLVLVTIFFYLTFPWEKLSRYIEFKVEEATGSSIEIGKSEMKFPLRMVWTDAVIQSEMEGRSIEVRLDQLDVAWALRPLLRRQLELDWSVTFAGGRGWGKIAAQPTDQGMQFQVRGAAKEVALGEVISFFTPNQFGINGQITISGLQHDWIGNNFQKGSGEATLEISDVRIDVLDLVFTRIKGHVIMRTDGVALLENVSAQGPALELSGSGDLLLRPRFSNSLVSFSSRLNVRQTSGALSMLSVFVPKNSGPKSIELSIRGILKRPTLYLNGQSMMTLEM